MLVAVSGGVDSLALLLLANTLMSGRVQAATVDHGLRPEGAAEARFVASVCEELGVPHAVLTGALPGRVDGTANLSARARTLRYRLLEDHRMATGCRWTATAHQADDQLETLTMRLNRGAGLDGLAGIRARVGTVVRPLIGWRRADLSAIVAAAGLAPVVDPTNADDRFDRARLRKALAGARWLDAERWGRSAAALAETSDALAWLVRRLAAERIATVDGGVRLTIADDPPEVVRRLVTECLLAVSPDAVLRGGEVGRLAERLTRAARGGEAFGATLAAVMITAAPSGGGVTVGFGLAPQRRDGAT